MISTQDKITNSVFKNSNAILFNPDNGMRFYGVEIAIEVSEKSVFRINYHVEINWENKEGKYSVSVKVSNFLINQNKPELLMEVLAERCRQPINELQLLLSNEGKILGILNHEAILKRWQDVKGDLRKEYSGKIFEKYVRLQDETISNKDFLLDKLKKDIFLSQFFVGIYNQNFQNLFFGDDEKCDFMNISYEIPVHFEMLNQGSYSQKNELFLRKSIDKNQYNFKEMPIENYKTFYTLDGNHFITNVMGKFEALNQAMRFSINLKQNKS
jgi:hypothetical protein